MDTFIKTNLGPTFSSNSLNTLVFMPEDSGHSGMTSTGATCMEDSSCYGYVGGVNWRDYDATYSAPDTVNSTPYPSGWATGNIGRRRSRPALAPAPHRQDVLVGNGVRRLPTR
jgi:hypothetical protein